MPVNMHVKTKNVMNILDSTGHSTVEWDPDAPAEVEAARIQFTAMVDKGYRAFRVNDDGRQEGSRLQTFDPTAEKIMFVPQLKGG